MKRLPLLVLCLTLLSAMGVLLVGGSLAREEKVVVVEESRIPATEFAARFLKEVDDLTSLYESHLLRIRDRSQYASDLEVSFLARNVEGIDQVTIFVDRGRGRVMNINPDVGFDSLPRLKTGESPGAGVVVDDEALEDSFAELHQWIDTPGYPLHFATAIGGHSIVVFRLNSDRIQQACDEWLSERMASLVAPLEVAEVPMAVRKGGGDKVIVQSGTAPEPDASPSLLLPVESFLGTWEVAAWDRTETIVNYQQPVLLGAGFVALILSFAGILGFHQQQEAVRLAEQRVSFVNRVSHELRTPLTNILLNLDLADDSLAPGQQAVRGRVRLIREETGRLSRLIENVLTFSRQEKTRQKRAEESSHSLHLEPCDVSATINEVLSQFSPTLERRGISVRWDRLSQPISVLADADALHQILGNLISNVEKYAADGGVLEIESRTTDPGDQVILAVSDLGEGIFAADRARVFEPFVRLSQSTTEGVSGTGLGLSISRGLAEQMGGTLRLRKRPDSEPGARFELTLPRAADNVVSMAS